MFLTVPVMEVMYGGAGGGGKSVALLMAALQYAQQPGYRALLLRRTFPELTKADGLIPLSHEWLQGTDARWSEGNRQWTFPGGAILTFGHLESERDKYNYRGPSFQFVGFDELTGFTETQYRYLFSRLRKPKGSKIPLRMRSGTNPGDMGHEWVKKRFITGNANNRLFIPARMEENPYLDTDSYDESLAQLDPVTRRQMRHGDWNVRPEGGMFKHAWFTERMVDAADVPKLTNVIRYWDLAATKAQNTQRGKAKDPDWAVGCKAAKGIDGKIYVLDARRFRESPNEVETRLVQTTERDGAGVSVRIEQEPGSSGKLYINTIAQKLAAYDLRGVPSIIDKITRAKPASAACERGDVMLVRGAWVEEFLDELCAFPIVAHDDQVDAFTGVYNQLAGEKVLRVTSAQPTIVN